jgi:hypothetical protein
MHPLTSVGPSVFHSLPPQSRYWIQNLTELHAENSHARWELLPQAMEQELDVDS